MNLWNFLSRKRRLTVTTTVLAIALEVTTPEMTRRVPRSLLFSVAAMGYSFEPFLDFFGAFSALALAGFAAAFALGAAFSAFAVGADGAAWPSRASERARCTVRMRASSRRLWRIEIV